jgi:ABC-type phosphate transport system ATPase subunit
LKSCSLQREQLFNVLWFNEGKAQELFPRMKAATMENKRDAFEAIKAVVPSGQTQPLDALKRALAYKPDVMFLLSDGDFGDDNKRIIQTLKQLNASHKTKINTILFVYDTMGEGERVLQEIAQTHRGTYKHVTEEDVRK